VNIAKLVLCVSTLPSRSATLTQNISRVAIHEDVSHQRPYQIYNGIGQYNCI